MQIGLINIMNTDKKDPNGRHRGNMIKAQIHTAFEKVKKCKVTDEIFTSLLFSLYLCLFLSNFISLSISFHLYIIIYSSLSLSQIYLSLFFLPISLFPFLSPSSPSFFLHIITATCLSLSYVYMCAHTHRCFKPLQKQKRNFFTLYFYK